LIDTASVAGGEMVFSDADGDGFSETVTITVATTLTDYCEVKVYVPGHNGEQEWEIRDPRTKTITGGNFVATYWAWQLIDPDYWEAIPTEAVPSVVVDLDAAVYLASVEVYREYNDPTAVSAQFIWEPSVGGAICVFCEGTGCEACALTTQDGCLQIRDAEAGFVVPAPATYDETDAEWDSNPFSVCRDPDIVRIWYYCGDLSIKNLAGRTCEPLSDRWARIIAGMAAARLDKPVCACGNAEAMVERYQKDMGWTSREGSYNVRWELLDNPFGTRVGEVEAWKYVSQLLPKSHAGAGAV
jgi:hypothetical protein